MSTMLASGVQQFSCEAAGGHHGVAAAFGGVFFLDLQYSDLSSSELGGGSELEEASGSEHPDRPWWHWRQALSWLGETEEEVLRYRGQACIEGWLTSILRNGEGKARIPPLQLLPPRTKAGLTWHS